MVCSDNISFFSVFISPFAISFFFSSSLLCSGSFFHFVNCFASTRINHSAICVIFFLPFIFPVSPPCSRFFPSHALSLLADLLCYSFDMNAPPFILFISIRGGGGGGVCCCSLRGAFFTLFLFFFSPPSHKLILLCSFLRPFFICSISSVLFRSLF
ncbi:hypothetical protein ACKS23_03222 [Histoplasma ohiense]